MNFVLYLNTFAESVWNDVLNMEDKVDVDYSTFEDMFAQKEIEPKPNLAVDNESSLTRRNSGHNTEVNIFPVIETQPLLKHYSK